tara:strand:- start:1221 stop:1976 length:756 start_codon:yes stop_codon:yes gene_type:complete
MPNAYDSSFGADITGSTRNVFHESGIATLSGIPTRNFGGFLSSFQAAWITDLTNCEAAYRQHSGASFTSFFDSSQLGSSGVFVQNNYQVKIRVQASSSYNTPTTGSITIKDNNTTAAGDTTGSPAVVGNLIVTSMVNPGTGGTTGGSETGTSGYGFEVLNANGVSVVNQTSRATNFIVASDVTIGAGATTASISCEGMTTANTDEVGVICVGNLGQFVGFQIQVNRGTNSFTITNNSATTSIKVYYYGVRY